jgi:hypothetical protein
LEDTEKRYAGAMGIQRGMISRLLKNCFQQPARAVKGCVAHLSNTQTFDKWSKAKTAVFALRAEKDYGRTFSASC